MNIQKSIAATLKSVMEKRNLTLVEFADEIGIARTSLQGYLKENSNPRADTIELLSERLNIPAYVLISGPNADLHDLEAIHIDELHPLLLPLLQQCQCVTAEIYRLSAELSRQEMVEGGDQT